MISKYIVLKSKDIKINLRAKFATVTVKDTNTEEKRLEITDISQPIIRSVGCD